MHWTDTLNIGLKGILLRKLRSLLSTLGIVFGVAAVISMMAIGEGARREMIEQIEILGTNNIGIRQRHLTGERHEEAERQSSKGLTYEDTLLIRERFQQWLELAPLKFVDADVRYEGRQGVAQIVGTSPEYEAVTNFRAAEGRFVTPFDLADAKNICVLGVEIKEELFAYRDALGHTLRIGDNVFTVVGVMESKHIREGRASAIKVRNLNRDIYIPITTALKRFPYMKTPSSIEEMSLRVTQTADLSLASRLVREFLDQRHRGVDDYEVMIPEELLAQAQRAQRLFSIVMGSIAGLSLLVGGIGIMNIMLANVSERTREIGIRRAIGATKGTILAQFVIETVLICLIGGIAGVLLGIGMAQAVTLYAGWNTAFSLTSILVAFGTAASIGLLFGLFPARQAAQLEPVQALRSE